MLNQSVRLLTQARCCYCARHPRLAAGGAPFPGWKDQPMVRSRHMKVFPYRALYYIEGDRVTFLAFAHEKRKPGYWKPRYTDQF